MKNFFLIFLFLMIAALLPAQTADKLEEILNTKTISYEQTAWLVLEAADIWDISGASIMPNQNESYLAAREQNWLPINTGSAEIARLDNVSLLLMEAFGLKGGLFYSLFKNPHYAYRELVYQGIIQGRADPKMPVSGDLLLFMVGRILSMLENTDWTPVISIKPAEPMF